MEIKRDIYLNKLISKKHNRPSNLHLQQQQVAC